MPAVFGGGDSAFLVAEHSRVKQCGVNSTATASQRTFCSAIRSVESMLDADASLHNSTLQSDAESAIVIEGLDRFTFIASWDSFATFPAPTDGAAADAVRAGSPAQGPSSSRHDISQLPTADDIKDRVSTTRLAMERLATANGMCLIDST